MFLSFSLLPFPPQPHEEFLTEAQRMGRIAFNSGAVV